MLKVVLEIGYWINNVHKPNKLPANLMRHLQHKLSIWITQNISNLIFFSFKQTNMQILCPSWQGDGDQSQMLKLWVPIFLVDLLNASLMSKISPFQVLKKNYFQRSGTFILQIWLTNNIEDILQIRLKYEVNWSTSAWDKCIGLNCEMVAVQWTFPFL